MGDNSPKVIYWNWFQHNTSHYVGIVHCPLDMCIGQQSIPGPISVAQRPNLPSVKEEKERKLCKGFPEIIVQTSFENV